MGKTKNKAVSGPSLNIIYDIFVRGFDEFGCAAEHNAFIANGNSRSTDARVSFDVLIRMGSVMRRQFNNRRHNILRSGGLRHYAPVTGSGGSGGSGSTIAIGRALAASVVRTI